MWIWRLAARIAPPDSWVTSSRLGWTYLPPCDWVIRHIETIARSTAQVFGDRLHKRANLAGRIGLQLRCSASEHSTGSYRCWRDRGEAGSRRRAREIRDFGGDQGGTHGPCWSGVCKTGFRVDFEPGPHPATQEAERTEHRGSRAPPGLYRESRHSFRLPLGQPRLLPFSPALKRDGSQ